MLTAITLPAPAPFDPTPITIVCLLSLPLMVAMFAVGITVLGFARAGEVKRIVGWAFMAAGVICAFAALVLAAVANFQMADHTKSVRSWLSHDYSITVPSDPGAYWLEGESFVAIQDGDARVFELETVDGGYVLLDSSGKALTAER